MEEFFKDLDEDKELLELVLKLSLLNAVKHDGKARQGSVISGVLGEYPDRKKDMKNLSKTIGTIINRVNNTELESQKELLLELDSSALDKKEKNTDLFKMFNIEEGQDVVTAFPPGPEKQPHIGHAKALLVNYMLAEKYKGEFILRFEDTNPGLVKEEYYDIMQRDFEWLGVKWDKLVYASDYMELYYKHCLELIEQDKAYICSCTGEEIKKGRETGIHCSCREQSLDENLKAWKNMPFQEPGNSIVRMKIDLKHKNSTMRDPAIMRINKETHARHGNEYSIWPAYDFQNAIMDGYFNVTHRLRSKEFEMRNELQRYIQDLLEYNQTNIYEFARFNLEGVISSGRTIREKIDSGELIGWDDPNLTTIAALRKRGFLPEAIKNFVISTGISKSEATMTWDDLVIHNKRLLDENADRYFFVKDPVEVKVENAPKMELDLNLHPTIRKGGRKHETNEYFYISRDDFKMLEEGSIYRFIECYNVRYKKDNTFEFVDENVETYKERGKSMLHYLPKEEGIVEAEVMLPNKEIDQGFAESYIENVEEGSVVQFERYGFARLDDKETFYFRYTHN